MAYNNLIRANDPMAINMLKENLAHFENNIAYMQAVNDYYKENGTMVNFEGIDYAEAVRLDERVNGCLLYTSSQKISAVPKDTYTE